MVLIHWIASIGDMQGHCSWVKLETMFRLYNYSNTTIHALVNVSPCHQPSMVVVMAIVEVASGCAATHSF